MSEREFNELLFHTERGVTTYKIFKLFFTLLFNKINSEKKFKSFWDYTPRVPYSECYSNHVKMINLIRAKGAKPVLLFHGIFKEEDYTAKALYEISKATKTPIVNVNRIYQEALEKEMGYLNKSYPGYKKYILYPNEIKENQNVKICFRVLPFKYIDQLNLKPSDIAVAEVVMFTEKEKGVKLETIKLNDEGKCGDEIPGDGIWTGDLFFRPDLKLLKLVPKYENGEYQGEYSLHFYFFFRLIDKNGKRYNEFNWHWPSLNPLCISFCRSLEIGKIRNISRDNLDYKDIPKCKILFYQEIVTPLYSYGKQLMRSEFLHPTKDGYKIFAEGIFEVVKKIEQEETNINKSKD